MVSRDELTPHALCSQLKRERFTEELESYAKQAEEFQTYGDMSEMGKYLKKAQALDAKLQGAADKVRSKANLK